MIPDDMPKPANDAIAPGLESPLEPAEGEVPPSPLAEIEAARAEIAALKDQLLRAMAETENTRRRGQREREDALKYGVSAFARDLLTVADNLRRALEAIPAEALAADEALKSLAAGVAATERELDSAFARQSIKRLSPQGERFDSNLHQAMFEVASEDQPAGTVVQVIQPGYTLHDRLLRPALVGVAKRSASEE